MTPNRRLLKAGLQRKIKELQVEVARLQARLWYYEGNEKSHAAHKPIASHGDSSTNRDRTTPQASSVTRLPPKHLQSTTLPPKSCTAPIYEVLVLDLKDASTVSVKSSVPNGDKALDEIRVNLHIWCSQSVSDISASHSNEISVRDPRTTLEISIHDIGKAWAKSIATSVDELNQGEMLLRMAIFYFLMFTLAILRLKLITNAEALDLIEVLTAKNTDLKWRRRLLASTIQINDDIIVELCNDNWTAGVATTALSKILFTKPYLYADLRRQDSHVIVQLLRDKKKLIDERVNVPMSAPDYIIQQVPELKDRYDEICKVLKIPASALTQSPSRRTHLSSLGKRRSNMPCEPAASAKRSKQHGYLCPTYFSSNYAGHSPESSQGHNVYTHPSRERYCEAIMHEVQDGSCWKPRQPVGFDNRRTEESLLTQAHAQPTEKPIRMTDFVDYAEARTNLEKSMFQPTNFALYAQDYTGPIKILEPIPIPPTNFANYARQYAQIAPLPLNNPCSMLDTGHTHFNFNFNFNEDHTWSQDLIS